MAETAPGAPHGEGESRRDFLYLVTGAFAAAGTIAVIWPFVDSMNPSADVLALATAEIDLSPLEEGQSITITWRGKPVFIRHRTAAEIEEAASVAVADLPDPQTDSDRAPKPQWLILLGICTHLGCVPLGQKATDPKGEFGGWFCPCHGSHYDSSGRIRKGPAPKNLAVPEYTFIDETTIRIG